MFCKTNKRLTWKWNFFMIFITRVLIRTSFSVNDHSVRATSFYTLLKNHRYSTIKTGDFLKNVLTHFVDNRFLCIFKHPLIAFHPGIDVESPGCARAVVAIGRVGYGDVIPQALDRLAVFVMRHGCLQPVGLVQTISWHVALLDFASKNGHTSGCV